LDGCVGVEPRVANSRGVFQVGNLVKPPAAVGGGDP
jgi:hypothetical protein